MTAQLRVLSLFAGIGGLDLGLEAHGCHTVAYSEVDPYASAVMAQHFPDAVNLGDITKIDWERVASEYSIDIICGGFPCQDISLAGKGAGIADGTRSGLWSCYADAIRVLRPRGVLVENVAALLARGLDRVLGDLAALGYDAWWDCVPAAAVGAPHLRDRLFIVATRADVAPVDTNTTPMQWATQQRSEPHRDHASAAAAGADAEREQRERWGVAGYVARASGARESEGHQRERDGDAPRDLRAVGADADRDGCEVEQERERDAAFGIDRQSGHDADGLRRSDEWGQAARDTEGGGCIVRPATHIGAISRDEHAPGDASGVPNGSGAGPGAPADWWRVEPRVGRVANGIPSRVDRLRCLGNAVVPQVAQYIGELVVAAHERSELAARPLPVQSNPERKTTT